MKNKVVHLFPGTGIRVIRMSGEPAKQFLQDIEGKMGGDLKEYFAIAPVAWGRRSGGGGWVYLIIDSNHLPFAFSAADFQGAFGPITLSVHPFSSQEIECALVLDIGNTRSCGLLLEDIHGDLKTTIQTIRPISADTDTDTRQGVFPSDVCLEHFQVPADVSRLPIKEKQKFGRPLSLLRAGHAAWALMRQASSLRHDGSAEYAFTSPKRFFWDDDPPERPWKMVSILGRKGLTDLSGELVAKLGLDGKQDKAPRSFLIGAMVTELLEQAEMELNSAEPYQAIRGPRRIRHLAVTCPPAWSYEERERYRAAVERVLRAYCECRGLRCPEIRTECDEASGTLLAYIANEIDKFNGDVRGWVAHIGAIDERGNARARVAVIDIGGGTSDLIIADLHAQCREQGLVDFRIERLYQDGVLVAGDEIVRRIAARVVIPRLAKTLCDNKQARSEFFDRAIVQRTEDTDLLNCRRRWAQEIWAPLAVIVLQGWEQNRSPTWPRDDLNIRSALEAFSRDCRNLLKQWEMEEKKFFFPSEQDTEKYIGAIRDDFKNLAAQPELLKSITEEVLGDAALRFSQPIALTECDLVLMCGKTSEFHSVRQLFSRYLPLPPQVLVGFERYRLSPKWSWLAGENIGNVLSDVKLTTVLGAAIELLNYLRVPVVASVANENILSDAPTFRECEAYWGRVNPDTAFPTFRNEDAIFTPGPGSQKVYVALPSRTVFLARRRSPRESSVAQIAYELRIRPEFRGKPENASVEIERTNSPGAGGATRLVLTGNVMGYLRMAGGRREPLTAQHVELRMRVAQSAKFWIAEGDLQEPIIWLD